MFYGGMSNVPGAPGNLLAGGPDLPFGGGGRYKTIQEQFRPGAPKDNIPIRIFPQSEPGREGAIPVRFQQALGSSNLPNALPGAAGNFAGLANAEFFGGPQLSQMVPQGLPQQPYGGAPGIPLTPEQRAKLLQQGTPPPQGFDINQYLPKAGIPAGFQGKYVS